MNPAIHYAFRRYSIMEINVEVDADMIEKAITHMDLIAEKVRVDSVEERIRMILYEWGMDWFHTTFFKLYPEGVTAAARSAAERLFPTYYLGKIELP